MFNTLTDIWNSSSIKIIPVISNSGETLLVQDQAANGWFLCKAMGANYMMDSTMILVRGDETIWKLL